MGYTHYFPQSKTFTDEQWKSITGDVTKLIQEISKSIPLESNAETPNMVTQDYINFNGVDEGSHETFYVSRVRERNFNFCKTNCKPYDIAVVAALLLIEHHAPGVLEASSDGEVDDWASGAYLNASIFGYGFKIPPRVRERDEEEAQNLEEDLQRKIS